ncbi:TetR/AcrR family transcriptional regulator [Nonomuraea sp. NPDC000554]|uniref:TetR/AcrR family transcriptional regulator n=1 Tax=Nonomuraea sp. NPDC000554 TaxID=3154259 RepID=UPI003327C506
MGLSRERIVWAAIQIANADGLESMSMRHVANVLGVKVMSLYNYIDGKDELIDLMVEAVFSEGGDSDPRPGRGWRAELEAAARWEWALYSSYPWVLEVIATVQPPLVPSLLARFERGLGTFDGLGLDPVTTHRIYLGVSGIAQGLALLRVSEIASERRGGGISLSQWRAVKVPAVLEELGTDRYPRQAALRNSPEVISDLEEIFEFSLQRLLDGIARFLESETGQSTFPSRF